MALTYSVLSTSWRVVGHDRKSEDAAKEAFQHSSRLGREDELLFDGAYYAVIGDVPGIDGEVPGFVDMGKGGWQSRLVGIFSRELGPKLGRED